MKSLIISICSCFFVFTAFCQKQQPSVIDSSSVAEGHRIISINENSKSFIRVLDGLLMPENSSVPKNIPINSIQRLSNETELNKMGLTYDGKPYMFLCSYPTSIRQYIYANANINYQLKEVNLPIILNNILITEDKYAMVENIDTSRIVSIKYIKPEKLQSRYKIAILGAVEVKLKKG
jgi:hypothetical protein